MIVDTSALMVILRDGPEARAFAMAIADTDRRRMSAANYLEAAIVIDGSRDPIASRRFDDLLREAGIAIDPVTEEQANGKPCAS
jgi:ribonuclease VapC